jgi:hypothetical protein
MSLHTAEEIGALVRTRLQTCTVAQGAETDLGATVYLGRVRIDDAQVPCAALIEMPDNPQGAVREEYEVEQPFRAFAYVVCDPANPNVAAHQAIRDMKRAIWPAGENGGRSDMTLGGAVKKCVYRGREIGPRADGAGFVVAAIEFAVTYVERLSQP